MKPLHVVYETGVVRPTTPVDLTEGSEVTVEPRAAGAEQRQPQPTDRQFAHLDPGPAEIDAILSRRYDGGAPDAAARHDEHQP